MKFDVVPMISINEIVFGMKREEIRAILGNATEFYKFEDDEVATDDFGFCHVFYDAQDRCEAIEIFNESEVYINDKLIFPTDFNAALDAVEDFEQDDDGLISYANSIGIYAPDEEMESILIGKKGYYDDEN